MKSIVLAEKPSVARDLARVLGCSKQSKQYIEGPKYIVTWALGHLVELKMPEDYNKEYKTWRMEDLPIIPKEMGLKLIRQVSHQYKGIEQLARRKDVGEFIIATDAGREGELVARWILEKLRWKKPVKRLWISSQTDRAIKDGFKNLKPANQYDFLYQSAVCRSEADWLIGLNVTRALTTKYNEQLSAGRVQTPALSMILEREADIKAFVPKEYFTIDAKIGPLEAVWEKNGERRIFDRSQAEKVGELVKNEKGKVISLNTKSKAEQQPLPYDLTELQRDANRRFGFSAKKTSSVLQNLYERYKLVTYPRTDSKYLTVDMKNTMNDRLQALSSAYRDEVQPVLKNKGTVLVKKVFNNDKVSDHHAIIPTDEPPHLGDLSADERKLYDIIVRRFLALFYGPYQTETIHAVIDVKGESFSARETKVVDAGFKKITGKDEEDSHSKPLGNLISGQEFSVKESRMQKKLTEPPARFNEADLLARMEKFGLGTPATRADIIERLLSTETIDRQNNRLHPTPKGKQLIDLVNSELKSPELTAKWEKQLEDIARGKGNPKDFLEKIRMQTKQLVKEIKGSEQTYKAHNLTGSKCPECGEFMKEVKGRDGKMLVCSSRECSFRKRKDPKLSNRRCPQCHKKMEIHNGKAGTYFQCRPCNVVEKAEDRKKTVSKREERQLMNKYKKKEEAPMGNSLADALKAALEKKD
ncbi:DNA topoisomerase-3 [Fictibacillus enclensis]|uniref:DNA topoisomerase n=1 Tax=Fictibacillus enclensis TaxID=1017270 RepID=A0A0V8JAP6_9BACL|nr:DNA topoisomerase III [Fictibacillus enclensis]KSU84263.1 DNA topoisomerase III [Fictibacillus enclensis]SCB76060.1 DNA topoisomerase-3 [Fictibacillus enclensis]